MSQKDHRATVDEFRRLIKILQEKSGYEAEWYFAICAGWDAVHFDNLYVDYVRSTQVKIRKGDDVAALKGAPLERLARYFLQQGGVATNIRGISAWQRWQIDGQGLLNISAMIMCFGESISNKLGLQLYMEAKNHSEPVGIDEFSSHCHRMEEHKVTLGIFFSTSGYKITQGRGIAESIHHNYLLSIYHLLLSFYSIHSVAVRGKAPLSVLRESLSYAANDSFSKDADVQEIYTKKTCNHLAMEEHNRLFSQRRP